MSNKYAIHDMQRFWVVIPAAGFGTRMHSKLPKQYLDLNGLPVISHTLNRFIEHELVMGIVVALNSEDNYWEEITVKNHSKVHNTLGGDSRADTVFKALQYLQEYCRDDDWVLVHDAARPCLRRKELDLLIGEMQSPGCEGGLLAVPVHDTLKRADEHEYSMETVSREYLWHAQTPQCFRYRALKNALRDALNNNWNITDDASAMERLGVKPKLIEGRSDNIKITRAADLELAKIYLSQQLKEEEQR